MKILDVTPQQQIKRAAALKETNEGVEPATRQLIC
jgi:hypothetical protein